MFTRILAQNISAEKKSKCRLSLPVSINGIKFNRFALLYAFESNKLIFSFFFSIIFVRCVVDIKWTLHIQNIERQRPDNFSQKLWIQWTSLFMQKFAEFCTILIFQNILSLFLVNYVYPDETSSGVFSSVFSLRNRKILDWEQTQHFLQKFKRINWHFSLLLMQAYGGKRFYDLCILLRKGFQRIFIR